jgi:hypothetical protein
MPQTSTKSCPNALHGFQINTVSTCHQLWNPKTGRIVNNRNVKFVEMIASQPKLILDTRNNAASQPLLISPPVTTLEDSQTVKYDSDNDNPPPLEDSNDESDTDNMPKLEDSDYKSNCEVPELEKDDESDKPLRDNHSRIRFSIPNSSQKVSSTNTVNNTAPPFAPPLCNDRNGEPKGDQPASRHSECSNKGVSKGEKDFVYYTSISDDPKTLKKALESPNKNKWKEAILKELDTLHLNNTWKLIDLSPGKQIKPFPQSCE